MALHVNGPLEPSIIRISLGCMKAPETKNTSVSYHVLHYTVGDEMFEMAAVKTFGFADDQ